MKKISLLKLKNGFGQLPVKVWHLISLSLLSAEMGKVSRAAGKIE
jgi:hypothetical protein